MEVKSAIILCGGKATRMGDICRNWPKALLDLNGRRVIEYQFDLLVKAGVKRVVLATGHLHSEIESSLGNNYNGLEILYSNEKTSLGTGGAFKQAVSYLNKDEYYYGLNGDILMPEFNPLSLLENNDLTDTFMVKLTVTKWTAPFGTMKLLQDNPHLAVFQEKRSELINAGFYLFSPEAQILLPKSGSIEINLFEGLRWPFVIYNGPWFDIGSPQDYQKANEFLKGCSK